MTDSTNLKIIETTVNESVLKKNTVSKLDIKLEKITENDIKLEDEHDIKLEDEHDIKNTTELLINNYIILKKLSIEYINNSSFKKEQYPLFVTFYMNESLKLNLKKEMIINNLNRFSNENLSEYKNINFMKINERLVETRFSVSKINKATKLTHIKSRNIILRDTLHRIKQFLKDKDIDINNIIENIYEIIEDTIKLVNQYEIRDDDKNQIVVKVITNIIENMIKETIDLTPEHDNIIKNVKDILNNVLPYYIESFINEDINEDVIIETRKCITKLLLCCLLKK